MDWHSKQHNRFDDVPEPYRFLVVLVLVVIAVLAPVYYPNYFGLGVSVFIICGMALSRAAYHATNTIKKIKKGVSDGTTKS